MSSIDPQLFREALLTELRSAWQTLLWAHPAEHFYSFGLYTAPCAEYLMVTASTEEGLSAVTERYLAHEGGDPILTRASLRWSPCDSPIHKEGESLLAKSEQLRAEGPAPYEDSVEGDQAIALVFDSSVDVLRQLDSEKLFGTSAKEARVKMLIYARWSQSIHSSFLCFSDYSNSAGVLSERCTETFHSRLRDVSASK